jgi:catechol 2,3-dioxygenase-like lactoylglutathione lyase family enzyme
MKLNSVRLLVDNLPACLAFYRDVMGLELMLEAESGVYAQLIGEGVSLGLYQRELMADVVGTKGEGNERAVKDTALLVFEVENVDASMVALQGKGAQFLNEALDQEAWFMRVAHLRDPDGNLIELFHSIYEG